MNPADPRRLPFLTTVVPEARRKGMGVIGMKVMAAGMLVADGAATPDELIRYAVAHADTAIIGCSSLDEVRQNLNIGRSCSAMSEQEQRQLEKRLARGGARYDYFKAG
jgi:hypothetical protein